MIPSRQPHKEFIIREPDMMEVCRVLVLKGNPQLAQAFESVCRSRPHTSPPAPKCPDSKGEALFKIKEPQGVDCEGCESKLCAEVCREWQIAHDAQVARAAREQVPPCIWTEDEDGIYHTSCGHAFELMSGEAPSRQGIVFCPYCGGSLRTQQEPQGPTSDLFWLWWLQELRSMGCGCSTRNTIIPVQGSCGCSATSYSRSTFLAACWRYGTGYLATVQCACTSCQCR